MFKNSFLIFLFLGLSHYSLAQEVIEEPPIVIIEVEEEVPVYTDTGILFEDGMPPKYDEAQLEKARVSFGVNELDSEEKLFSVYDYRGEGTFIISKEKFSKASDANAFCDSASYSADEDKLSYELVGQSFAFLMTFTGMPFPSLLDSSYIYKPVLESEGLRSGVIFWVMGYSPETDSDELTPELLAFTNGNGAGAGGFQILRELNERMKKAGLNPVAMPAICFDENLKVVLGS